MTTSVAAVSCAQAAQRGERVGAAAGDADLFLGADDQVALRRRSVCSCCADRVRLRRSAARRGRARSGPTAPAGSRCRATTRVPRGARQRASRAAQAAQRLRLRQVRAGEQQRARRRDERRRRRRRRRAPCRRSGRGRRRSGKVSRSRMPRKTSAVSRFGSVVTWPTSTPSAASVSRTKRPLCSSPTRVSIAGLQAEARDADGGVGRRAAEVLGERAHVLEPAADLLAVQVDRGAAHADDVERALAHRRVRLLRLRGACRRAAPSPRAGQLVAGAHDQRLREAERRDQRAERPRRVVAELEADVGGRLQRRQRAVGDGDHRDAARAAWRARSRSRRASSCES